MKKILILYTSHTIGHKTIAENIGYHLEKAGYEVKLVDALEAEKTRGISVFLKLHTFIYKYAPIVWRWVYLWGHIPVMPFLKFMARFHSDKIRKVIEDYKPGMVISTQISPSGIVSYLKSKGIYRGLFGITFSDFHFHAAWTYPNADFYLANLPEQKEEMVARGIPEKKIFISGITVKPKPEVDTAAVRRKMNLTEGSKVVLVGSGSLGVRLPTDLVDLLQNEVHLALRERGIDCHAIIVCGRNEELYNELKSKVHDQRFHILGFHEPMSELYAIADIFVSKPGGLSTIEALQWNLPIFVTHLLPGQEELNLEYLEKKNLVIPLYVKPERTWAGEIVEELVSGSFRASLKNNPGNISLAAASNGDPVIKAVEAMFHE